MIKDRAQLRDDYYNTLTDLQYKRRKSQKDFVIIALIMAYFMEFLTNENRQMLMFKAPFILQIKNVENAKAVVKAIDEGLNYQGKLATHLKEFIQINRQAIDYLTPIIPQKEPEIKAKGESKAIATTKEKADLIEKNNEINHIINQQVFSKKMKQWNTQRDSKVRQTQFHNQIDRQVVAITENFTVGQFSAKFPSDKSLPPFDRYGCRCYLTYFN
jgi:hypothetical protein